MDLGSRIRKKPISDPRSRIQGSKKHRIPDPDPQHWKRDLSIDITFTFFLIGHTSAWERYHWIGLEKNINRYMFFTFLFWSWIFEKSSKDLSRSYKNASNPPTCWHYGLYRILSSCWLGHFHLMKNSAKVLHYSGLDCGMLEFLQVFFSQAIIQRPNVDFPHFWRPVWRKKLRFLAIQPVIPTSRRIRCFFVFGSELWSLLKNSKSKLKNQKPLAVDVLFQAYSMVPLSCRSNLVGWYLWCQYETSPTRFHPVN